VDLQQCLQHVFVWLQYSLHCSDSIQWTPQQHLPGDTVHATDKIVLCRMQQITHLKTLNVHQQILYIVMLLPAAGSAVEPDAHETGQPATGKTS